MLLPMKHMARIAGLVVVAVCSLSEMEGQLASDLSCVASPLK